MHQKLFDIAKRVWGDKISATEMDAFISQAENEAVNFTSSITRQIQFDNYLEAFLSSIDDIVFELDSEGRVINSWATDDSIFWYDRANFMYKRVNEYIPAPLGEHLHQKVTEVQKNKMPIEVEYQSPFDEKYFAARINSIKDNTLKKNHVSVVIRDITERKNEQQQLIEANEKAKAAIDAKAKFLSSVSHEIRTPMNAIMGLTDVLLEQEHTYENTEYLKSIKFSSENLLVLINEILNFNKIEAGKVEYEHVDFDLPYQLHEIKRVFGIRASRKNIVFDTVTDKEVPQIIVGDPYRLNQVFMNIIGNAIKFTDAGRVLLHTSVVHENEDRVTLRFRISDTGIGIPKDKFDTIFESFVQATADTTRFFGGTGLGLSIAKNIVEQQGGSIYVESEVGKGSTFTIEMSFGSSSVDMLSHKENDIENTSVPHLTILVAEDNVLNQLLIKKILGDWNANYIVVDNGLKVLETLKEKNVDIVLMDLHMSEMDGFEATKQIRSKKSIVLNPEIPIIALTADAFPDTRIKVLECGMNDFISKPFKRWDLCSKMSKYVNMSAS